MLCRYLLLEPLVMFVVYVTVEIPLLPVNWFLSLFFDMNLRGLLLNYKALRNPNLHRFPLQTEGIRHRMGHVLNNVFLKRSDSDSFLYLKQLRYGLLDGAKPGLFHMIFSFWDSLTLHGPLNLFLLLFFVYKYIVIAVLFSALCAMLTVMCFLVTKVVVHPTTFQFAFGVMFSMLGSQKSSGLRLSRTAPSADIKLDAVTEEEDMLTDEYGNLDYLRGLKSSTTGIIEEEDEESDEEDRLKIPINIGQQNTLQDNSNIGYSSGVSTHATGTLNSVFTTSQDNDTDMTNDTTTESEK